MSSLKTLAFAPFFLVTGGFAMTNAVAADTSGTFVKALLADACHESIPPELDIFAPLLGSWKIRGREFMNTEEPKDVIVEVEFVRALAGRAIQDIWIWPIEAELPFEGANRGYGTTLRVYDPREAVWEITWLDPVDHARVQLTARKVGWDIVQIGANAVGHPRRWTFTDITERSFTWRGEHSDDGGRTWKLNAEYFAERVGGDI